MSAGGALAATASNPTGPAKAADRGHRTANSEGHTHFVRLITQRSPNPVTGEVMTYRTPVCDGADVSVSHAAIAQVMTASNSARVAPSRACMERPCTMVV